MFDTWTKSSILSIQQSKRHPFDTFHSSCPKIISHSLPTSSRHSSKIKPCLPLKAWKVERPILTVSLILSFWLPRVELISLMFIEYLIGATFEFWNSTFIPQSQLFHYNQWNFRIVANCFPSITSRSIV